MSNEEILSLTSDRFIYKMQTSYMSVYDSATAELRATFNINALLVKQNHKVHLQRLMLKTNTPNTYILSLEFKHEDKSNTYSLTGRNTATTRELARKLLLSGLSTSDYPKSIEEARSDTLLAFSDNIVTRVFNPNDARIHENLPLVHTWLTKLLG
jgi:hypothetical protein